MIVCSAINSLSANSIHPVAPTSSAFLGTPTYESIVTHHRTTEDGTMVRGATVAPTSLGAIVGVPGVSVFKQNGVTLGIPRQLSLMI